MQLALRHALFSLVVLSPIASAQAPAYFDDFTYTRVGSSTDRPGRDALLGTNSWRLNSGREAMRGWRLGFDDDVHSGPAASYFGGPGAIELTGAGVSRYLRLAMSAGFPFDPALYTRPPLIHTAQAFVPGGTFAARVRFSTLEEGQRMIEAFWLFASDQYRFCPSGQPDCDVRNPPSGTLQHADEADFEFNNWFLAQPTPNLHATAVLFREAGANDEYGANGVPLACHVGGTVRPQCMDQAGRSLIPGRWYVLVFRVDSATGAVSFDAVEDEPGGSARLQSSRRLVRPEGGPVRVERTRGRPGRNPAESLARRSPLVIYLSLHYAGRAPSGPTPSCDGNATCQAHTLDTDWVYHSSSTLQVGGVVAEVAYWRSRGEARVNTLGRHPVVVDPPTRPASGNPARLVLQLDGPTATRTTATWIVRPISVRGIIYKMDVEVQTTCHAGAASCTPRTLRPRSHSFTLTPAPGESGMVIRARLFDPWWGYSHVPSPGSTWREWRVTFRR